MHFCGKIDALQSMSSPALAEALNRLSKEDLRRFRQWAIGQMVLFEAFGPLVRVLQEAKALTAAQLRALLKRRQRPRTSRRRKTASKEIIRTRMIKCGKSNCRCARGHLHGPYEYAYKSVLGEVTTRYLGPSSLVSRVAHESKLVVPPRG